MKLKIRRLGDPILRQRAHSVHEVSPEVIQLAEQMIETMIASQGVGLAAPQVGKLLRLFVRRDETLDSQGDYVFGPPEVVLNPTLSCPSKETESALEGCLSLPRVQVEVRRPKSIHLRYQTLEGQWVEETLEGHRARVVMHENDHLNGVLIIDRLSKRERKEVEPQLQAIAKNSRGAS